METVKVNKDVLMKWRNDLRKSEKLRVDYDAEHHDSLLQAAKVAKNKAKNIAHHIDHLLKTHEQNKEVSDEA